MIGFGMRFGLLRLILMLLFWGGLIFGAVWLVRNLFRAGLRTTTAQQLGREQSAREILDQRYARGEITRDQYEGMRQDLEL